jgi:hypothetical protein
MQVRTYNRMNALNKLELVEKFIVIDVSNRTAYVGRYPSNAA